MKLRVASFTSPPNNLSLNFVEKSLKHLDMLAKGIDSQRGNLGMFLLENIVMFPLNGKLRLLLGSCEVPQATNLITGKKEGCSISHGA